jgi:predicted RNA-binding protein associated with RNAse of E/G family
MIFDPSEAIRFAPGRPIVRRNVYDNGFISAVESARVVSDDDFGLLTWTANGSDAAFRTTLTGESVRKMPLTQRLTIATMLTPDVWRGTSFLALTPPGAAHSVWWFFDADLAFTGWYVNLEAPAKRWYGGIDIRDHALDIWVEPDRTWRWKDEDEFAERTGVENFWNAEKAARIRAEGERVIAVIEAGLHPFDGLHTGFRPDAAWEPTRFGPEWDLPRPTLRRR